MEDDLTAVVASAPGGEDHHDEPSGWNRRRSRRSRGWLLFVMVLALVAGSAIGGYLLWDQVLAPVTPIPEVLGAEADQAVRQLEEDGFVAELSPQKPYDLTVPLDHVLAQEPTGSTRLGETVTLVLSAGPRPVEVPQVVGESVEDAQAAVTGADLVVASEERYHPTAPQGTVITTEPSGGEVVDEASTITIVVSLGPEPLEVPSVIGAPVEEARTELRDLDLELVVVDRRHDPQAPADSVLSQEPEAEATLYAGDTVEVVVSDGPAPVEVPNLRGMVAADAVAELEELGLDVEVERRGGLRALISPDRVYEQDPAPGTLRERGGTVLLYAYES